MKESFGRAFLAVVGVVLAALAGCTGAIMDGPDPPDPDQDCPAGQNRPPERPTIESPRSGARDVVPDRLEIVASPASDPDGHAHAGTEAEIWLLAADTLAVKVWSVRSADPSLLTRLRLVHGHFEAGFDGLEQWTEYGVRVRYSDDRPCGWGDWSEVASFKTSDGSEYLFESDEIHTVEIEIPPTSWDFINAQAIPEDCIVVSRDYAPATLRFEGEVYEGIGLRTKGGCGSSRDLSGKPGFKAHLSWDAPDVAGCPQQRRLHGLKRLTLNNQVQDASYIHERVGYYFYRLLGVPVPRAAPIRVEVNGDYWGLYLNLETVDRRMLAHNFESNRGMLYEGNHTCDLRSDKMPSGEQENCFEKKFNSDECSDAQPGDDPTSFSLLRDLTAQIEALPTGGFYPNVEEYVDFDAFLSMWAGDTILNHWDGHVFNVQNNYRIYHDPGTDLWTVIPSGIDQTFAPAYADYLNVSAWSVSAVLASRCLEETDCEQAFAARLEEAVSTFETSGLADMARAMESEIEAAVASDPRREISVEQFHSAVDDMIDFIDARPGEVRAMLAERGY